MAKSQILKFEEHRCRPGCTGLGDLGFWLQSFILLLVLCHDTGWGGREQYNWGVVAWV